MVRDFYPLYFSLNMGPDWHVKVISNMASIWIFRDIRIKIRIFYSTVSLPKRRKYLLLESQLSAAVTPRCHKKTPRCQYDFKKRKNSRKITLKPWTLTQTCLTPCILGSIIFESRINVLENFVRLSLKTKEKNLCKTYINTIDSAVSLTFDTT